MSTKQPTARLNANQRHALLTVKARSGAYVHYATALALQRRGLVTAELNPYEATSGVMECTLTSAGHAEALRLQGYGRR